MRLSGSPNCPIDIISHHEVVSPRFAGGGGGGAFDGGVSRRLGRAGAAQAEHPDERRVSGEQSFKSDVSLQKHSLLFLLYFCQATPMALEAGMQGTEVAYYISNVTESSVYSTRLSGTERG